MIFGIYFNLNMFSRVGVEGSYCMASVYALKVYVRMYIP